MTSVLPEDLVAVQNEQFLYLTTVGRKSGRPHTVEIWFAHADGIIFLSHEGEYTDWMKNINHTPRVRARVGRVNFEAHATIVKSSDKFEEGKRALYEKYYGPAPKAKIDDWFELSTIIELRPITKRSL